jgi:signal transduction histidine kinase
MTAEGVPGAGALAGPPRPPTPDPSTAAAPVQRVPALAAPDGEGATVPPMSGSHGAPLPPAPQAWPAGPSPDRTSAPARDRTRSAVRSFLLSPFDGRTWRSVLAILVGFVVAVVAFTVLTTLFSAGGSLLIWLIGIPIIALGIEACRLAARVERWRMTMVDGRPLVPHAYRTWDGAPRPPYGTWLRGWAEAEFIDGNRWLDVAYVVILLPLAILELTVSLVLWVLAVALVVSGPLAVAVRFGGGRVLADTPFDRGVVVVAVAVVVTFVGLLLVPVAASTSRGLMTLHRAVVQGLLCVDPTVALRRDVERLRGSRSAALELEASELRRFERDLHDGAQQRLVRLALDLGLAEERIDTDPVGARSLVAGAREQAQLALAEIRDLVRGTAPSILLDRGLVAAVSGVAAGCPVPTTVDSGLADGERLPPAVERAAYFVVAESLANVGKHSGAARCEVTLRREPATGRLIVDVRDDGAGGAEVTPGGGLAGLRDRAAALDGVLFLVSPPGGPTVVHVEIPVTAG